MAFPSYRPRQHIKVLDHRDAPSPWAVPEPTETAQADEVETHDLELTDAERARTIARSARIAVLNVYNSNAEPPSGFSVPFCSASNGTPLCAIPSSWLHAGAISEMARVSMTISETPLTATEATLHVGMSFRGMLRYMSIDNGGYEARLAEFSLAQPKVGGLIESGQSRMCFIATEAITVTDAYGIRDVDCAEYLAAEVDPLAEIAPTLVNFLVVEHGASLAMLCNAFGESTNAVDARLVSVDHLGLDIAAVLADGTNEPVRVGFSKPVFTSEEVRAELGILIRAAAFKQG